MLNFKTNKIMGSFDKTCCLTNTAISENEKCLVIILNENVNSIDELKTRSHYQLKGAYEDFIKDVTIGTYDGYGDIYHSSIKGQIIQMYHVWAIESLLNDSITNLLKNKVKLCFDLYDSMISLRRSPVDLNEDGYQEKTENIIRTIKLNNRINKYLNEKLKKRAQNDQ